MLLTGGEAKHFSSGLDLRDHAGVLGGLGGDGEEGADTARRAAHLHRSLIRAYQESFASIEACPKPVIALVHGACVGGGVDMVTAADIRLASADATFCVKEVEVGLAADLGTLQRLPRCVRGDSWAREVCLTAREFSAEEAAREGLVSAVLPSKAELRARGLEVASSIAKLSPVAVQGTKVHLNYSRGRTVADALEYQAAWNMAMLQTDDIPEAAGAAMTGQEARFSKL